MAAGAPRLHISAVLNHVEGGARSTRVYDRYSYDNEKRAALTIGARRLQKILKHQGAAEVLTFGSAKGAVAIALRSESASDCPRCGSQNLQFGCERCQKNAAFKKIEELRQLGAFMFTEAA